MSVLNTRRRKLTVAGAVLALLSIAGVAVAAFFIFARVTGGVSSAQLDVAWSGPSVNPNLPPTTVADGATCTASYNTGALNIGMTNVYPGGSCTYTGRVHMTTNSTEGGVIKGITLPGLPAGWTAEVTTGCDMAVPVNTDVSVSLKITMTATAAAGSSGNFPASGTGLRVVPASQSAATPAACTYVPAAA